MLTSTGSAAASVPGTTPTQRAVRARIDPRTDVGTDPGTGKPTLTWLFDQTALDTEAATDGWYALFTNLPATIDTAEVLRRFKGQEAVERRYGAFKGPLAVAPVFLHNNRRITALITVIYLALLIFCLVERQVRHAIAPDSDPQRARPPADRPSPTGPADLRCTGPATPDPSPRVANPRSSRNRERYRPGSWTCLTSTPPDRHDPHHPGSGPPSRTAKCGASRGLAVG